MEKFRCKKCNKWVECNEWYLKEIKKGKAKQLCDDCIGPIEI